MSTTYRRIVMMLATALAALILACGGSAVETVPPTPTETPAPAATAVPATALFPYTVVGSDGTEVTFKAPPERIMAFDSAVVEILFAIGEGGRVVGTHDFVSYPPEAADIPRVGDASNMNIEATVALKPDLVFVFFDRFVADLERVGLKVLYLKSLNDDFRSIAESVRVWGRITGSRGEAERVAAGFEARVAAIEAAMSKREAGPSVLQDVGSLWTPGPDTLMGEVFGLLKLQNIAHDISGYAQISPEVIVERDPAVILALDPDSIIGNAAFAGVTAVKDNRVFTLPSDALSIASTRFVDGIEELAALVYPGLLN